MNTSFFSFTYNLCYKKNNLLKSNNSHTLPSLASTDFQGPWPLTPPWLLRICSTCESQKDEWASALVWIFKIRKPRLRFTYPFTDYRESAYDVPRRVLGAGNSGLRQTRLAGGKAGGFWLLGTDMPSKEHPKGPQGPSLIGDLSCPLISWHVPWTSP